MSSWRRGGSRTRVPIYSLHYGWAYGVNSLSVIRSALQRAVLFTHELGRNAGADQIDPTGRLPHDNAS
jgi:hypothetical protein